MDTIEQAIMVGGIFVTLICATIFLKYRNKQLLRQRVHNQYGNINEYSLDERQWKELACYSKEKGESLDDITWSDLDMGRIFEKINTSFSWVGESFLYYLLRNPLVSAAELKRRQTYIHIFEKDEKLRESVLTECAGIGKKYNKNLYDQIFYLLIDERPLPILDIVLFVALIASIIQCIFTGQVWIPLAVACGNVTMAYSHKSDAEYCADILSRVVKLNVHAMNIAKLDWAVETESFQQLEQEMIVLRKVLKKYKLFINGGNNSLSAEESIIEFLTSMTHIDKIQLYFVGRAIEKHREEIEHAIEVVGFLESMIMIASFRESLEYYCEPEVSQDIRLEIEDGYHILVSEPVVNSISTKQGVLLTGSNASGKSTFLKTVAISAILGQTIVTVPAKSYVAPIFRICSSMSLRDNIAINESYYIAEIKAIKRMLDASKETQPLLCFVDEVFRGTNTIERIAAATEVLRKLVEEQCICFAATHDIELTSTLEKWYANYHFYEKIVDNQMQFDYQIRKGRAETRNAIALLDLFEYGSDIVQGAMERIYQFEEHNTWSGV